MCNHRINFPIDAGINDVIKLVFTSYDPQTQVYFAVGHSYETAHGQVITDLSKVKVLKVGFPHSVFLTIVHPENHYHVSDFGFDFLYKD